MDGPPSNRPTPATRRERRRLRTCYLRPGVVSRALWPYRTSGLLACRLFAVRDRGHRSCGYKPRRAPRHRRTTRVAPNYFDLKSRIAEFGRARHRRGDRPRGESVGENADLRASFPATQLVGDPADPPRRRRSVTAMPLHPPHQFADRLGQQPRVRRVGRVSRDNPSCRYPHRGDPRAGMSMAAGRP